MPFLTSLAPLQLVLITLPITFVASELISRSFTWGFAAGSYKCSQPPDTWYLLQVVDSMGRAGGVPPQLWRSSSVEISGQCSNPPRVHPPFKATSNVSAGQFLDNCEPWKITIEGGIPPYSISFFQPHSNVITNVTMPGGDNVYTYVNSSIPDTQLMATVSDVSGHWATNPPVVNTTGVNTETICAGQSSSTFILIVKNSGASRRTLAIALSVSIFVSAVLLFLLWRFRRNQTRALQNNPKAKSQHLDYPTEHSSPGEFSRYSTEGISHSLLPGHPQDLSDLYITTPFEMGSVGPSTSRLSNPSTLGDILDSTLLHYSKASMQSPSSVSLTGMHSRTELSRNDNAASADPEDFPPPYVSSSSSRGTTQRGAKD
ncbi:hypothetical protein BJ165DRAFT_1616425 [Panaeolus papilionaceus]|nr:hypothetical protein BJ165DRAFT_1616425 [Panaeolus papilionaceus]